MCVPCIPFLLVASWWPSSSQDANASTEAASLLKPMVGCSSFKTVLWTLRERELKKKKKNPARPRPFPAYKPGEKAGGAGAGTRRRPDRRAPRGRSPGLAQGWSARPPAPPTACQRFVHVRGLGRPVPGSEHAPKSLRGCPSPTQGKYPSGPHPRPAGQLR